MCQQKSSLILKCFWFQRRLLSRGVWGDKNSYDIGVFGFLLIKSWSVERDGKRFIKILEEPQNDGNVPVSGMVWYGMGDLDFNPLRGYIYLLEVSTSRAISIAILMH